MKRFVREVSDTIDGGSWYLSVVASEARRLAGFVRCLVLATRVVCVRNSVGNVVEVTRLN